LNAPAVTPLCRSVPPRPTVDACLANSGGSQLPPTRGAAALNAPQQSAVPGSYLQALLTPAKPRQTLARRPAPIVSTTGCFRCLASDHLVRECRDPVRCRNCRGCDHRLRSCPMRIARVLTPWPRSQPTAHNPGANGPANLDGPVLAPIRPAPLQPAVQPAPAAEPPAQIAPTQQHANLPALLFHVVATLAKLQLTPLAAPPATPPATPHASPMPGRNTADRVLDGKHPTNPPPPPALSVPRGRGGRRPRSSGTLPTR
jgi:hypothetical protein